jgi:hypothetical protein
MTTGWPTGWERSGIQIPTSRPTPPGFVAPAAFAAGEGFGFQREKRRRQDRQRHKKTERHWVALVLRWFFDVVDDEDVDRSPLCLQRQAELFLQGGEDGGKGAVVGCAGGKLGAAETAGSPIGDAFHFEFEAKIKRSGVAGQVEHGAGEQVGESAEHQRCRDAVAGQKVGAVFKAPQGGGSPGWRGGPPGTN